MANLPYCRFQNTLRDLKDCAQYFDDELSVPEHKARLKMLEIIKELAEYEADSLMFEIEDEDEDICEQTA
jgi:uncharacterized protein YerC